MVLTYFFVISLLAGVCEVNHNFQQMVYVQDGFEDATLLQLFRAFFFVAPF